MKLLTIKNSIIKNIWPNTELHLKCKPHTQFVTMHTMHLFHCELFRDFNWKSRNMKNAILSKLKILKNV